ncbi:hypothetical protein NI468_01820 [Acinetobacter lwoffii]|uniref:hypothetical protein n=1 Tax=Acinetobacter lwoffii TaxID=28090 RepID=UPI002097451F|nr:hypothetical protein [Acinetobacter lwoffii]MCO8069279.1 hypothetical protein [Acinetobacter lwoffii]
MAVSEQTPYIEHIGNGVTTSFALKFQCESKDHLIVLVDEIEPPIASWSLVDGNVVFTTAPASGKKITLQRNTPFNRNAEYQSFNNSFRPQTVNIDFDRIWWKLQELGVADWLMKLYVDRLHQQQEQKINDLKGYVDDRDDELRAYLLEEIRKQGVALDQLDEYYNYLMERLAQIAVDKGWDASFVVDASGKTQQQINTGLFNLYNPLSLHHTPTELSANFASPLNALIDKVSAAGGGTISVPDGEYRVNPTAAIVMKDNVHLKLGHETVIKALPTRSGGYDLIRVQDVENTKVSGGRLVGDRYTHLAPNGSYYKDWKPNTYYEAGEYICQQYHGCLVTVSGTTGATRPDLQATGSTYVDGTCQYQYKENVGEWGYGIMIRGGKNNTIEDVEANDFWGDSLLISRSNTKDYAEKVTVKNFKADGSRRQGITIGSVKGLRMTNLDLSNISGTLPMAGIDFEPDLGVQWLQDIVVDGVRTTNCEGEGIAVGFVTLGWRDWSSTIAYKANRDVVRYQGVMYQATQDNTYAVPSASSTAWKVLPDYDITQDRVSIEVRNHTDRGSRRGVWALGTQANQNVTGYVKFINPSYENKNNNNVFIQNNRGDGVQFYFEDPEFINNTQNSSDYHVRLSNAPADYSLGGVHLIRPKFKCKGIDTECFYIYANNNNGLPNINISIIDIVERPASIISPVNMITRDTANVFTSDKFNKLRLSSSISRIIQNVAIQHEYYIAGDPTSFEINSFRKGQIIRVVNESTSVATINFNVADGNIAEVTNASNRKFNLAAGGSVEMFGITNKLLRVIRSEGLINLSRLARGTVPFPATTFAANESKLIATVATLTADRYTDTVSVSSTMDLVGNIALSATINNNGTISIYGTNLKSSQVSYGAAGQYLNVVVH